jgi:hypothetical protein
MRLQSSRWRAPTSAQAMPPPPSMVQAGPGKAWPAAAARLCGVCPKRRQQLWGPLLMHITRHVGMRRRHFCSTDETPMCGQRHGRTTRTRHVEPWLPGCRLVNVSWPLTARTVWNSYNVAPHQPLHLARMHWEWRVTRACPSARPPTSACTACTACRTCMGPHAQHVGWTANDCVAITQSLSLCCVACDRQEAWPLSHSERFGPSGRDEMPKREQRRHSAQFM